MAPCSISSLSSFLTASISSGDMQYIFFLGMAASGTNLISWSWSLDGGRPGSLSGKTSLYLFSSSLTLSLIDSFLSSFLGQISATKAQVAFLRAFLNWIAERVAIGVFV